MLQMLLKEDPTLTSRLGDFGAKIIDNALNLPTKVIQAINVVGGPGYNKVHSFLTLVQANPIPLADTLGWTLKEVAQAHQTFISQFSDQLPTTAQYSHNVRQARSGGTERPASHMPFIGDKTIKAEAGNYKAHVDKDGVLHIPAEVAAVYPHSLHHNGALALYGLINHFPTSVMKALNWQLLDMEVAQNGLKALLRQTMPEDCFTTAPQRTYEFNGSSSAPIAAPK